jgi:AbrB family looped-hinge helix DNA binding protein
MTKAIVCQNGQIVIPAEIRQKYGLVPGTELEIFGDGDSICLFPVPKDPVAFARGFAKPSVSTGKTGMELLLELRAADKAHGE